MNKKELAHAVKEVVGFEINKGEAEEFTNAVFDVIANTLASGDVVDIHGHGKYSTAVREARVAKNPKTGEEVQVPSKTVPKFKSAKKLKDTVLGS